MLRQARFAEIGNFATDDIFADADWATDTQYRNREHASSEMKIALIRWATKRSLRQSNTLSTSRPAEASLCFNADRISSRLLSFCTPACARMAHVTLLTGRGGHNADVDLLLKRMALRIEPGRSRAD